MQFVYSIFEDRYLKCNLNFDYVPIKIGLLSVQYPQKLFYEKLCVSKNYF